MTTDSFLATTFVSIVALFFAFVLAFAGYRLFLVILPIWGFVFGFVLGGQTIQAIFGQGFLATATGWIVGFIVAIIFAALSYLFYFLAVGIVAGSVGYMAGISIMGALGVSMDALTWLVGIVLAIVVIIVTYAFNLQKWVVEGATALLGAGVAVWTMLYLFYPVANVSANPVRTAIDNNIWLLLLFLIVAICGFVAQYQANRKWEVTEYNRMTEYT